MIMVVAIFYIMKTNPTPHTPIIHEHKIVQNIIQPPKRVFVEREVCKDIRWCELVKGGKCPDCVMDFVWVQEYNSNNLRLLLVRLSQVWEFKQSKKLKFKYLILWSINGIWGFNVRWEFKSLTTTTQRTPKFSKSLKSFEYIYKIHPLILIRYELFLKLVSF